MPFSDWMSFIERSTSICSALPCGSRADPYGTGGWSCAMPSWYQKATLDIRSTRSPNPDFTAPSALNVQPLCSISTLSDFWNGTGSTRCQR